MTGISDTGASAPVKPLALPALSGSFFALGVNMLAPVGLAAQIAHEFRVSTGAVAFLLTASALAYALCAPILQMVFGAKDRRTLIIAGLCLIGAGSLTCAASPALGVAIAGRLIMGAGFALVGPMVTTMAASIVPPQRSGRAIGIGLMGMTISLVAGIPLVTYLGERFGWRLAMVLTAGICLLMIALLRLQAPAGSRGARSTPLAMLGAMKDPVIAPALWAPFFQFAAVYSTYAMIAALLTRHFGLPAGLISTALLVYGVAGSPAPA